MLLSTHLFVYLFLNINLYHFISIQKKISFAQYATLSLRKHFVRVQNSVGVHHLLHLLHQRQRFRLLRVLQVLGLEEPDPVLSADTSPQLGRVLVHKRFQQLVNLRRKLFTRHVQMKVRIAHVPIAGDLGCQRTNPVPHGQHDVVKVVQRKRNVVLEAVAIVDETVSDQFTELPDVLERWDWQLTFVLQ